MEKVRIGIIGCGGIANGKHMPALSHLPNAEMVAFCDLIEERAIKAKHDYGTPDAAVYTDYKKLLEDKTIDVVHVLTPNRAHSFITVDALDAGKHVMCEKPMAINSVEAKKMLDSLKVGDRICTIGGIYGTIVRIKDDVLTVEVGEQKTQMVFARWAIRNVEQLSVTNDAEQLL